jgi:hypothetical protein
MYSGAHNAIFGADHQISRPQQGMTLGSKNKDHMKAKFLGWGINIKWVVLFPHVDDFNGRDAGQNFLGCVSRTVLDTSSDTSSRDGYMAMQRQTMTFCQCKVHEDTMVWQVCVGDIHEGMRRWTISYLIIARLTILKDLPGVYTETWIMTRLRTVRPTRINASITPS